MLVTTAISLYLYFQVLCQVLASVDKGTKSCDMLSKKQILSAPRKNSLEITRSSFWSEFFTQHAIYNWETFSSFEFFYLSYRSAPNKLSFTCCSVFPDFCPVLHSLLLDTLFLVFLCKNLQTKLGNSSYCLNWVFQ